MGIDAGDKWVEYEEKERERVGRYMYEHREDYVSRSRYEEVQAQLTHKIRELEAQIEKMKCCFNCRHSRTEYEHCKTNKHEKWEIKENE